MGSWARILSALTLFSVVQPANAADNILTAEPTESPFLLAGPPVGGSPVGGSPVASSPTSVISTLGPTPDGGSMTPSTKSCGPKTMTCKPTSTPPVLDADLSDWDKVEGIKTSIYQVGGTVEYPFGSVSYKCVYDETSIYFAFEIPGEYRFSATDNQKCAAIATMMKIGSKASFYNMGGCPDALLGGCPTDTTTCDDYLVDIGAHWELASTRPKVPYPFNTLNGTGNDPIANNDDEYAVSPYCRLDDNGSGAGNEWSGAWAHSDPNEGELGTYTFELSRLLTTMSAKTDVQLAAGETFKFGIAYWDPFQMDESGWSDSGHYLTNCGKDWIDLVLEKKIAAPATATAPSTRESPIGGSPSAGQSPIGGSPIVSSPHPSSPTVGIPPPETGSLPPVEASSPALSPSSPTGSSPSGDFSQLASCIDTAEPHIFYVASTGKLEDCQWLASNPTLIPNLCVLSHQAFFYCALTCKRCETLYLN
jgi:hypothetical protein